MRQAIAQSKALEYGAGTRPRLGGRDARNAQRHFRVLERGELRKQMVELEDEADVLVPEGRQRFVCHGADVRIADPDGPGIGAIEAAQQVQQRALAHTGRADHRHHLAALDGQIEIAQHVQPLRADLIALVDVAGGEKGHAGFRPRTSDCRPDMA